MRPFVITDRLNSDLLLPMLASCIACLLIFSWPAKAQSPDLESNEVTPLEENESPSIELPAASPEDQPQSPHAKSVDESRLSNGKDGKMNPEFPRALLFPPEENGVVVTPARLKWEFTSGTQVNLNGLRVNGSLIAIRIDSSPTGTDFLSLSFGWPETMTRAGSFSIETLDGHVKWQRAVSAKDRATWVSELSSFSEPLRATHRDSQWGLANVPRSVLSFLNQAGPYQACLSERNPRFERIKICTPPFTASLADDNAVRVITSRQTSDRNESAPTVSLNDKERGARANILIPPAADFSLRIRFDNHAWIEVINRPVSLKLLDAVESSSGKEIILTGEGARPPAGVKITKKPETSFWSKTGLKNEVVWQFALSRDNPTIYILGAFNIPYTFTLSFKEMPKESDRVFITDSTMATSTYSETPRVYGLIPEGNEVSSREHMVRKSSLRTFQWNFAAPYKGQQNRALVKVKDTRSDRASFFTAAHTMYRGFSFEASTRLTGVLASQSKFVALGETVANGWFETLFGWENERFSKQRWGLTARYFQTLSPLQLSESLVVNDFDVLGFDVKYNIIPGIWNRDELVGLMLGHESVTLAGVHASLFGPGVYWARSMPRWFDDVLNLIPGMKYRKYVDMEFIVYPLSSTAGVRGGLTFNLNFHGKVFWTPRFYGEAGFGLKQFEYFGTKNILFNTSYGAAGLGYIF